MTEVPASPPCDICGAEPAIGSLMQMGTWETTRFGMDCAPDYLRTIADAISGVPVEGDTPDAGPAAPAEADAAGPDQPGGDDQDQDDDDQSGSAEDHWASTKHVVRSTHGHRGGRARTEDTTP